MFWHTCDTFYTQLKLDLRLHFFATALFSASSIEGCTASWYLSSKSTALPPVVHTSAAVGATSEASSSASSRKSP